MSQQTCKNCKFYCSEPREDQQVQKGKCKRFPPSMMVTEERIRYYFPIVTEFDACGEHLDKPVLLND
jgi:hypothetical protein